MFGVSQIACSHLISIPVVNYKGNALNATLLGGKFTLNTPSINVSRHQSYLLQHCISSILLQRHPPQTLHFLGMETQLPGMNVQMLGVSQNNYDSQDIFFSPTQTALFRQTCLLCA